MSAGSKQAHTRPKPPRETVFIKHCPTTKKRGYTSKKDALVIAARACRTFPQRAYECPFCDDWHLTSKPDRRAA